MVPLTRIRTLAQGDRLRRSSRLEATAVVVGCGVVALILASIGLYAMVSVAVGQRRREIGIRLALGASPGRIVLSTFSRALAQVGLGLVIGSIPAVALLVNLAPEVAPVAGNHTAATTCLAATCFVAIVTTLACIVPARRALLVQPTDALKVN